MQEYFRWYDKHKKLKKLLNFFEKLPLDRQETIYQDILQIIFSTSGLSIESSIRSVVNAKDYPQLRWYDSFSDLTSSLEVIRDLPEMQQETIINAIIDAVYQIFVEYDNEQQS